MNAIDDYVFRPLNAAGCPKPANQIQACQINKVSNMHQRVSEWTGPLKAEATVYCMNMSCLLQMTSYGMIKTR